MRQLRQLRHLPMALGSECDWLWPRLARRCVLLVCLQGRLDSKALPKSVDVLLWKSRMCRSQQGGHSGEREATHLGIHQSAEGRALMEVALSSFAAWLLATACRRHQLQIDAGQCLNQETRFSDDLKVAQFLHCSHVMGAFQKCFTLTSHGDLGTCSFCRMIIRHGDPTDTLAAAACNHLQAAGGGACDP